MGWMDRPRRRFPESTGPAAFCEAPAGVEPASSRQGRSRRGCCRGLTPLCRLISRMNDHVLPDHGISRHLISYDFRQSEDGRVRDTFVGRTRTPSFRWRMRQEPLWPEDTFYGFAPAVCDRIHRLRLMKRPLSKVCSHLPLASRRSKHDRMQPRDPSTPKLESPPQSRRHA